MPVDDPSRTPSVALEFLEEFRAKHGRAPRLLHVGNIANNAYQNAKFLNRIGFDCDVICYDYYHLMGCPEWEDADFEGDVGDHFRPDWSALDLGGFERPVWFAQGPPHLCIEYLVAKRTGHTNEARRLWKALGAVNRTRGRSGAHTSVLRKARAEWRRALWSIRAWPNGPARLWVKLQLWAHLRDTWAWLAVAFAVPFLMLGVLAIRVMSRKSSTFVDVPLPDLRARFAEAFPDRADQLLLADYAQYAESLPYWAALFGHYDLVQAYATDVVYPLLAQKRPYLGFEHGTLRDFTLGDHAVKRMTALGYQQADHVFITNGDCLAYAERINVPSYSAMIHPVDDDRIRSIAGDYEGVHRELGAKYVFLCPIRHDWTVKGTDQYIRALPLIADRIGREYRVIMCRWGMQVADSQALARTLGVEDLIVWVEPLNRAKLVRLQKSSDIVFDQIALPHFGATAPQALAAGVPVIMSYDPASTAWIIPEPAPILSAWTPEEIAAAVQLGLAPAWRAAFAPRARDWFERHHSNDQVVQRSATVYRQVCRQSGIL